MRLFSKIFEYFSWLFAVMGVFSANRPVLTPVLVVAMAVANITRILAFFIPLKVLLLIATPGVPRYFRFFVDPELRNEWAIGLSIAAVVCYLLTLLLDRLSERWSELGSRDLLSKVNQLSVIADQKARARQYYSSFCSSQASLLLVLLLFAVGVLIHPWLFAFLSGFLALQLLISWAALRRVEPRDPKGFGGYILRNLSSYLGYLFAINFLAVFVFLVLDFLLFDGINVLIAILSFLISRQILGALSSMATTGYSLSCQRKSIDPLVFREEKHVKQEKSEIQSLRHHFAVEARRERIQELLAAGGIKAAVEVEDLWQDPAKGSYLFQIVARDAEGDVAFRGQERVLPSKAQQALENEDLIIEHMGAGPLLIAPVHAEYEVGDFHCRLYELGECEPVSKNAWKKGLQQSVVASLWRLSPPQSLREVFELSRPYLWERFDADLLRRFELALDEEWKSELYERLSSALPALQARLKALPLFPHNAVMGDNSAFVSESGEIRLTDWGKWSLEPVGVGIETRFMKDKRLAPEVEALRARKDAPDDLSSADLRLAALAFKIEELVTRKAAFNEAFGFAEELLGALAAAEAGGRSDEASGKQATGSD
ncbi:hypothetical protein VCB98_10810 [Gammaproteobacteria bacterium AB-CW1]|uniref:Uncharacterized protein n=1 Tax=Natronospira elongata TaxID=3110268 RepID=A0AAP6MLS9_9GAMM|nr:hypothetical protein [Gammaproteobacteria bacterium AB-CW1]